MTTNIGDLRFRPFVTQEFAQIGVELDEVSLWSTLDYADMVALRDLLNDTMENIDEANTTEMPDLVI